MRSLFLVPALLALTACEDGFAMPDFRDIGAAGEPTVQLSDKARLVNAIAANGCAISTANVGPILQQASVSADQSKPLLTELAGEGALVETGEETLTLTTPPCI